MIRFFPRRLPKELEALTALALDLSWTWSHAGDVLWRTIDAEVWEQTGNPWFLLQDASQRRLEDLAADPQFRALVTRLAHEHRQVAEGPTWFASNGARLKHERIAYFSMEFGLGEAIPLYAGGLGILAGDYLKTASDLGLPIVGVGILFQEGYFRQAVDGAGRQHEAYPYNDPTFLPIQPVTARSGGWLRIPIELPGRTLWLRLWRANVGRVDLYLLDANEPINSAADRGITAKLYGGNSEMRIQQEMVLGIGGYRALAALGLEPTVTHLNEGHAAFVVVERARRFMQRARLTFREALWATRAGNVFTTHTPVAAGFDAFSPELVETYFPPFSEYMTHLGVPLRDLLALGRLHRDDAREPFNMAYLAMHGCARVNAVSRLHGAVSRRLFAGLYPRWPEREVPVEHVTNGVHVRSWDSRSSDELWTRAAGKSRWGGSIEPLGHAIGNVTDEAIWTMRNDGRDELIAHARRRLARQLAQRGVELGAGSPLGDTLAPGVLTLGFARRFAEYKRPNLLLRDRARLARILNDPRRPMQIVIAGKAHPADEVGKHMIADWVAFVNEPAVRQRAVFLEDYDMALAALLVGGVDVWLNTPRRPWEACGTSGMKVLANGGINLSELDGWWAEAFDPEIGWAIGEGGGAPDDARDAAALYALLEQQIAPEFYERDSNDLPRRWLARVRASMARLAPVFSSNRMALEYAEQFYAEAGEDVRRRLGGDQAQARSLSAWEATLEAQWSDVHIAALDAAPRGEATEFFAEVHLGALGAEMVRVELYADPLGDEPPFRLAMQETAVANATGARRFSATHATRRPLHHFTPRVIPFHPEARVPSECNLIAWAQNGFTARG